MLNGRKVADPITQDVGSWNGKCESNDIFLALNKLVFGDDEACFRGWNYHR